MTDPFGAATATATAQNPFGSPAPAPATAQSALDPFAHQVPRNAPASKSPTVAALSGRLVLLIPKRVERNVPNQAQPGTTQDRMTADLVVLDGAPVFTWTDNTTKQQVTLAASDDGTPFPQPGNGVGITFAGKYFSQKVLIGACEDALNPAKPETTMVLGRVFWQTPKGQGGNGWWDLSDPTPADIAAARAFLSQASPFG